MSNRTDRMISRRGILSTLRVRRTALALLAACALLAAPVQAEDRFENLGPLTFDVLVLRPLTAIQVAVGTILLVPTAVTTAFPTAFLSGFGLYPYGVINPDTARGNVDEAFDIFVREPYERAVLRPLGAW